MRHIINFLIKNKHFILFLVLLSTSLLFTIQSHSYHRSKFINSANSITGGIYQNANDISTYFSLRSENDKLVEENRRLRNLLFNQIDSLDTIQFVDNTSFETRFRFRSAKIIKNSYSLKDNVLLIDKGATDSIAADMGVITTNGVVGVVDEVGSKYATVISILHTYSRINAKIKNTDYFGTLRWDGKNPNVVQLTDLEKLAKFRANDTIITGGNSTLFPKGIPIGVVKDYELNTIENLYVVNIQLFNDMTNLEHIYIIENLDREEIDNLLKIDN